MVLKVIDINVNYQSTYKSDMREIPAISRSSDESKRQAKERRKLRDRLE